MALIIETGAIVANSNSYVERAEAIAYAIARGVVLADDETTDVKLVRAADYLEMFRAEFVGNEVQPGVQSLAWPRVGATVGAAIIPITGIPFQLKRAQMQLAVEQQNGVNIIPSQNTAGFVTKKKIGPIETEYSEAIALQGMSELPTMPAVDALVKPLLGSGSGSGANRSYRV